MRCAISRDAEQFAEAAARWVGAFHPGVEVMFGGDHVLLASDVHDASQLEAAWVSTLANERLVRAAAPTRAAVLEFLLG